MIKSSRCYGNVPSVKTITSNMHWVNRHQAKMIRMIIKDGFYEFLKYIEDKRLPNPIPRTTKWVDQCHNEPKGLDMILEAINEIIEGHGVERIRKRGKVALEYINMGDTYTPTIVFNHETWTFRCCSWGDIVESGRYD